MKLRKYYWILQCEHGHIIEAEVDGSVPLMFTRLDLARAFLQKSENNDCNYRPVQLFVTDGKVGNLRASVMAEIADYIESFNGRTRPRIPEPSNEQFAAEIRAKIQNEKLSQTSSTPPDGSPK